MTHATHDTGDTALKAVIQEKYGALARHAGTARAGGGCCSSSAGCGGGVPDSISSDLYTDDQREGLPAEAVTASLGCGNPTALADLHAGETVLDLGSGGGIVIVPKDGVIPAGTTV